MTTEEKAARAAERKALRVEQKEHARIEAEKNQKPVKTITINIEWRKSRTWGNNPFAEARVVYKDGTGIILNATCSGCGYDKESTVIADIFNQCLKYKLWTLTFNKDTPYGIHTDGERLYFDGGIGTSCYYAISKAIGGEFVNLASGKTFDAYKYTDNN